MVENVIRLRPKKERLELNSLTKLLNSLVEKERLMVNPLLKDWFAITNQIRKIRRTIKEIEHANNK